MSAYWKIPLQALVLVIGVLVFVYYQFQSPPLLYNPAHEQRVVEAEPARYQELNQRHSSAVASRLSAAQQLVEADARGEAGPSSPAAAAFREREQQVQTVRGEALELAEGVTGQPSRDVNYVIPRFVLDELPLGLAGIFIAAVMAAAMSSIAAELNSLSTATVIDFYRRWMRPTASDAHYLTVSKWSTAVWGVFSCIVATYAVSLGSLIEVVNRFGSFFYGSILGVFLLAMIPWIRGSAAFFALIAGMVAVGTVAFGAPSISFLWHNVIGVMTVIVVGTILSFFSKSRSAPAAGT